MSINPKFNFQLPGILFQTAVSQERMAFESRTKDQIFITLIDLSQSKTPETQVYDSLTLWHSLVSIEGDNLVLQQFENKKNPDQVSYHVLSTKTGQLTRLQTTWIPKYAGIELPSLYLPNSSGFETVNQFVEDEVILGCEYFELNENIILSYHTKIDDNIVRRILLVQDNKIILNEVQDQSLHGFAPQSFFTFNNMLFFAKEKSEINIYAL